VIDRELMSSPETVIWLAMLAATTGPPAMLGAPVS
jgi:hypothetical protein